MRLSLFLTTLLSISISAVAVLLTSSDSNVYAIVVNKTFFSVNVSNNWAYASTQMPNREGSGMILIPTEFSDILTKGNREVEKIFQNLSVYSLMIVDMSYPFRNVPLDTYVQYRTNTSSDDRTWRGQNTTIDGEKALKVYGNVIDNSSITDEVVGYYVFHDGAPYWLEYYATEKDFQKYLPQFEQMVKTFKFAK